MAKKLLKCFTKTLIATILLLTLTSCRTAQFERFLTEVYVRDMVALALLYS